MTEVMVDGPDDVLRGSEGGPIQRWPSLGHACG